MPTNDLISLKLTFASMTAAIEALSLRGQFLARNRSYICCVDMPHNLLTKAWSDLFWTGL